MAILRRELAEACSSSTCLIILLNLLTYTQMRPVMSLGVHMCA